MVHCYLGINFYWLGESPNSIFFYIMKILLLNIINPNQTGRGLNQLIRVFKLLRPHFHPNQSKHGLKWNLAPSYTYLSFEKYPWVCNFTETLQQSKLVWLQKVSSFLHDNFQKFIIFSFLWTICTSNESWKHYKFKFEKKKHYC